MAALAACVLFGWAAVAGGYGAYAAWAALATGSTFHANQAGVALLIATVSVSAGVLVAMLGRLGRALGGPPDSRERDTAREE